MGLEVFYLLLEGGEPSLHVAGDGVDVKGIVAVAQDHLGTVVTRDDDITVLGVEDVVHGAIDHVGVHLNMGQFHFTTNGSAQPAVILVQIHKTLGLGLCAPYINGVGQNLNSRKQECGTQ